MPPPFSLEVYMKIFKRILVFCLCAILVSSPILCVNYVNAYSVSDTLDDIVGICSNNVKNCVDTVANGLDAGWRIVNNAIDNVRNIFCPERQVYTPISGNTYTPYTTQTHTNGSDNYTVNYYSVDNNNGISDTYTAYNNDTYYDYTTNEYITTNNAYYNVTNNEYNTYNYEFNDNRVFITETYNSIVYTYVDTSTKTVDCYICSFVMPSGDSSFNYSSGYCKGLYWIYDVVNYDYELDDNSILAYWRLDGDLHNEVPNSEFVLNYTPVSFDDGKFGSAMRCDGPFDMCITKVNSNGHIVNLPNDITVSCWYFNGDPNYKAMSQGWHYIVWEWVGTTKYLWLDGIQSGVTTGFAQSVLVDYNTDEFSRINQFKYAYNGYTDYKIIQKVSAYHPMSDIKYSTTSINQDATSGLISFDEPTTFDYVPTCYSNPVRYSGNTYSGYGMDCPTGLHYPPLKSNNTIYFPWTGTKSTYNDTYNFGSFSLSGGSWININNTSYQGGVFPYNNNYLFNGSIDNLTWKSVSPFSFGMSSLGKGYSHSDTTFNVNQKQADLFDDYDLSGCYFDEIVVTSGLKYPTGTSTIPVPFSRQELQVGYIAPSSVSYVNTLGLQSTVPLGKYRIGGTIPTIANTGDVWVNLENGFCVSCVQYYDGSWHQINFGVYDGEVWRNGYTFNFYTLSFGNVDADTGSNPTSVVNNYYNDVNEYLDNNTTSDEKQSIFDFGTFVMGVLSSLLTFAVSGIALVFGNILPSWIFKPILTFIPILGILIIAKVSGIFKK